MALLKQSTAYTRLFKMISALDHFSLKTGLAPSVNLSKAGAVFSAAAGTVTEVGSGWYKVALTSADTSTLGDLAFYITAATADDTDFCDQVVANILGDTLPVNMTQILGTAVSAPATAGILDVNVKNIDNDAASASGTVTFPNATLASTTNITAGTITTVTNLTNAATAGDLTATMKTSVITAVNVSTPVALYVTGDVGGNVQGNVNGSVGSVVGLTASNLDTTVSSRLATAGYTAPDNATITAIAGYVDTEVAAIKAKTDQLTFTKLNELDANIQSVNDTTVNGNGGPGTEWGP
jgi:hypothetical protein